jgi:hypothetical protein
MNLLCDVSNFQPYHVCFLETRKNMVIEGSFTKIIYSDSVVSLNGLYIHCPLEPTQVPMFPLAGSTGPTHSFSGITQVRPTTMATYQENGMTIVTRKIAYVFSLMNATNIHFVKELNRIEHELIEYYKEYFKINKTNTYSLRNQLKTGNIRVIQKVPVTNAEQVTKAAPAPTPNKPLIIKISGVWETDISIGITYKFTL